LKIIKTRQIISTNQNNKRRNKERSEIQARKVEGKKITDQQIIAETFK